MQLLTRYAIAEFLKVFLLTLFGVTMFMLVIGVGREAVREGLGLGPILRVLPYIVPVSMRFSIPASALLAACVVFGRMSADNEMVAIKSLGISPVSLVGPVFAIAFLISLFAVWINDTAVSWGRPGMRRVVVESIEQIAYAMLRTQRSYSTDNFSINVKHVEGRRLIRPTIVFRQQGGERITVSAREAELFRNAEKNALSIVLTDTVVEGSGGVEGAYAGTFEHDIPLGDSLDGRAQTSPSDYPLRELQGERNFQDRLVTRMQATFAATAAQQLLVGDLSGLSDDIWWQREAELDAAVYRLNRLHTEPWRRWSNGFSCLFFVVVGAPLAMRLRNADFVTSFFLCFLPILILYYPLMAYGVDQAKDGNLPQYAVWLGNAICGLCGVVLLRRVLRY